uniref:Deubiquitinating enzyme A n=1 Tax=Amorphochlora amoebiformis TaxID=1561963 RepID=A0A7S0CZY4_9EUKA|mmetsp:Transcript_16614/g.26336  ORF Transcript_16614/g.26336 Transcript_16614/m.26336 type:complete len:828 (+) Transcript_16614:66-2549(+)
MGNQRSTMKEVKQIFAMLDVDQTKTLSFKELQMLTLCTPLARKINSWKKSARATVAWNKERLVDLLQDIGVDEAELQFIKKVLTLKGLPNRIFQILDQDGKGYIFGSIFNNYVNSKREVEWIKEKVDIDQLMAAVLSFGDDNGALDAPQFARALIEGGFKAKEMELLLNELKKTYPMENLTPPKMPELGITDGDLEKGFCCDVRDVHGLWCSGSIKMVKKNKVLVTYNEWGPECDEWVDKKRELKRFAPLLKYSQQNDLGVRGLGWYVGQRVMVYVDDPPPARWRIGDICKISESHLRVRYAVAGVPMKFFVYGTSPEIKAVAPDLKAEAKESGPAQTRTNDGKWWVGQIVEVLDTVGKWEPAAVKRIRGQKIFVHYVNWSSKWDEWLSVEKHAYKLRALGAAIVETKEERDIKAAEQRFRVEMLKNGLEVVDMTADGNCLFRTFAHQIYGDQEKHMDVRRKCFDYLQAEEATFAHFVEGGFNNYLQEMRQPNKWGGHIELAVLRELFNVNVEIYHRGKKINGTPIGEHQTGLPIVRLSYHGKKHYNSVVDERNQPPFGDGANGKNRGADLRAKRKGEEAKEGGRSSSHVKLMRALSQGDASMRDRSPPPKVPPAVEAKSNLSERDYAAVTGKYMDPMTISVSVDKMPVMINALVDRLFKKKTKAYPARTDSLKKLRAELEETIKIFNENLAKTVEITDNMVFVPTITKQIQDNLLPTIRYSIRLVTGTSDGKKKADSKDEKKAPIIHETNQELESESKAPKQVSAESKAEGKDRKQTQANTAPTKPSETNRGATPVASAPTAPPYGASRFREPAPAENLGNGSDPI